MVGKDNEMNWTLSLDFILVQGTKHKAHPSSLSSQIGEQASQ